MVKDKEKGRAMVTKASGLSNCMGTNRLWKEYGCIVERCFPMSMRNEDEDEDVIKLDQSLPFCPNLYCNNLVCPRNSFGRGLVKIGLN